MLVHPPPRKKNKSEIKPKSEYLDSLRIIKQSVYSEDDS